MNPSAKRSGFAQEAADLSVGLVPPNPELLLVLEVRALFEPGIGDGPVPRFSPSAQPSIPFRRIDILSHELDETRGCITQQALDSLALFQ